MENNSNNSNNRQEMENRNQLKSINHEPEKAGEYNITYLIWKGYRLYVTLILAAFFFLVFVFSSFVSAVFGKLVFNLNLQLVIYYSGLFLLMYILSSGFYKKCDFIFQKEDSRIKLSYREKWAASLLFLGFIFPLAYSVFFEFAMLFIRFFLSLFYPAEGLGVFRNFQRSDFYAFIPLFDHGVPGVCHRLPQWTLWFVMYLIAGFNLFSSQYFQRFNRVKGFLLAAVFLFLLAKVAFLVLSFSGPAGWISTVMVLGIPVTLLFSEANLDYCRFPEFLVELHMEVPFLWCCLRF